MQINMKGYNLDYFKQKDLYTWDEIISIMEEMERDIYMLKEELYTLQLDLESNYKRVSVKEQVE